ncbi:hypothetical protein OTU49_004611, partial [Cherax quadricarinatus]
FLLEYTFIAPRCGDEDQDKRPEWVKIIVGKVHYLHFRCILFLIVLAVTVAVSFLTEPIPKKCLHRLTYATRHSQEVRVSIRDWRNEKKSIDDKIHLKSRPAERNIYKATILASDIQGKF